MAPPSIHGQIDRPGEGEVVAEGQLQTFVSSSLGCRLLGEPPLVTLLRCRRQFSSSLADASPCSCPWVAAVPITVVERVKEGGDEAEPGGRGCIYHFFLSCWNCMQICDDADPNDRVAANDVCVVVDHPSP
ncbi:hypothetical protein E2562_030034 [Oryza meyeriana var. granulata]|uniref:Uncharacterized protein n=1 Tax=Oryza meyeriana var. granulata TaxID=110450 RepID=A0A6G1EC67_9ORYZ|nr:hypothetical protein E2562_030034 [Oryza meyeriana var. granulata]